MTIDDKIRDENYNMILTEKQQKYQHSHQVTQFEPTHPLPPPPLHLYKGGGGWGWWGGLTSSNLAIRLGMKYFFQKGRGWKERGRILHFTLIFIKKRNIKMISNLFEFSKSFFEISKHKIRAPFLLVGTNMHILNLDIG